MWPDGLAGIRKGGLFRVTAPWVSANLPPGHSSQTETLGLRSTLVNIVTLNYLVMSPNLVWLAIAAAIYIIFPYDIAGAGSASASRWIAARAAVNFSLCFAYTAFFRVQLYWRLRAERKYRPEAAPGLLHSLHNLFYWSCGVMQWTWWEWVACRLWAAQAVPYVSDDALVSSTSHMLQTAAWVLVVPIWRDIHFYMAHRMLHVRALYKNADPEPFSGISMHPVEHMYYFSNAFIPALLLPVSPFVFLWLFVHLSFSPAAGHSGYEDHFQSDQYHYLHHARFECNYGSPFSAFIDQAMGTFRERLGSSKEYTGEHKEEAVKQSRVSNTVDWSPNGKLGLPASRSHAVYAAFTCAAAWLACTSAVTHAALPAQAAAAAVALGPLFVALLLHACEGDRQSWRYPFHKERIVGSFGLFCAAGLCVCAWPVYAAMSAVFSIRGQAF